MGIFEAIKELANEGIKTYCLQMEGELYFKANLTGPVAFILGDEEVGISNELIKRCTSTLAIPMRKGIDSLNVSVSASVVIYEKVRQDSLKRLNVI